MISKIIDKRNGKYYIDGNQLTNKASFNLISQIEEGIKNDVLFASIKGVSINEPAAKFENIEIREDGVYAKLKAIGTPYGKKLEGILGGHEKYNKPYGCKHIGVTPIIMGNTREYITILPLRILNWFWITKFIRKKSKVVDKFFKKYTIQKIISGKLLGFDILPKPTNTHTILIN